jgi:hypothetical protein
MSDVQVLKADKDFSKEVDKQLPEAEELAKVNSYDGGASTHMLTISRNSQTFKAPSRSLRR